MTKRISVLNILLSDKTDKFWVVDNKLTLTRVNSIIRKKMDDYSLPRPKCNVS